MRVAPGLVLNGNRARGAGLNPGMHSPTTMRVTGEETEFREFAAAFSPTLVRAAYLLLHDREAAQDAAQTTLMHTFRRWRTARRAPEAYARRVLVNACRRHWRHQRRHPTQSAGAETLSVPDPVTTGERIEQRLVIEAALAELPDLHREVLVARFFLDLSVIETAELLRVPTGTVKSATHRALARLRDLLSDQPLEAHHAG
jgi:RNA polymerase sigma factor (sigma-70 family)